MEPQQVDGVHGGADRAGARALECARVLEDEEIFRIGELVYLTESELWQRLSGREVEAVHDDITALSTPGY